MAEPTPCPGYEEQTDSKKYEYKPRGFAATRHNGTEDLLTYLNAARAAHPALHQLRGIYFHPTGDGQILAYSKRVDASHDPTGKDGVILTVVSLDPHGARAGEIYLNLETLGLPDWVDTSRLVVRVTGALTGDSYGWSGRNYVRLDPFAGQIAHIFSVELL